MSKRKHSVSTFKEIWLTDPIFQFWIAKVPGDPSLARCKLCKSNINIPKKGRSALNNHAKEKRHLDIIEEGQKYTNANFFKPPSSTKPTTSTTGTLNNLFSHVSELFSAMFPDSEVAQKFSMGKTKSRYMVIYGLAPYFKKELLKKINSSLFYSVSFDESFNSELQKCQMDITVHYWDTKKNIAVTRYFESVFLDRPNASNLLDSLQESTKPLQGEKFLQLGMDGPNVNWNVLDGLDEQLIENGHTKTINIGSCA